MFYMLSVMYIKKGLLSQFVLIVNYLFIYTSHRLIYIKCICVYIHIDIDR